MYEQVLAWAVLVALLVLSLPLAGVTKLVLELTALVLRLAMIAAVASAGYLWFFPERLPEPVWAELRTYPYLMSLLPKHDSPYFGVCLLAPVVAALVPVLAVLDVCRQLAGRRLRRLKALASGKVVAEAAPPAPPPAAAPVVRGADRRAAADAMAAAARRPDREHGRPAR